MFRKAAAGLSTVLVASTGSPWRRTRHLPQSTARAEHTNFRRFTVETKEEIPLP